MRQRLFIADCGVVCALGGDATEVSRGLEDARRGFSPVSDRIAGRTVMAGAVQTELPEAPAAARQWDCRNNRLMLASLTQIRPAISAAIGRYGADRIAVVLGTSTGGIDDGEIALRQFRQNGSWPSDFDYPRQEIGNLASFAAAALGTTGPAYTVATACSSSAKVFASARRLIRSDMADAAIVGGADTLCRMTMTGFAALDAVSSSVCNPFSRNRDGITIGEGSSAFLLSTEPSDAEVLGIGESSDAHHTTAPEPSGAGARAAMGYALKDAGLRPEDIGYINLHGTGTPLNDAMEARAISSLFPTDTPVSSTKGMTGHMLGATGGVEIAMLWLTLSGKCGVLPPHVWDGEADPDLPPLSFVRKNQIVAGEMRPMLSNSFGFGGSNAAVILGRAQ